MCVPKGHSVAVSSDILFFLTSRRHDYIETIGVSHYLPLFLKDMYSSDGESSSEGDEMPWQQMWLSTDSDLDFDAFRGENNW